VYARVLDSSGQLRLYGATGRWFDTFHRWPGGPGMDVFSRQDAWPAVRRTVIDYHAPAFPGDVLRFAQALTHHGRTSFTMRQTARRTTDDRLIATAEFVFVSIDRNGRPTPVPRDLAEFLSARPAEPPGVSRMTVNGVSLAVERRGEGPAVLFVHGYPLDRTLWAHQVAHLEGFHRIAPDLRGFGLSDAPDLGYSLPTYADDLAALLDALQVDEVVLCGLSMGGYVAFEFLRRFRERVRGLVLMDTRADADAPEVRRMRDQQIALARDQGAAAIAETMVTRLLAPDTVRHNPTLAEQVRAMMVAAPVPGIAGALAAMRDRPDSTPLLDHATPTRRPTDEAHNRLHPTRRPPRPEAPVGGRHGGRRAPARRRVLQGTREGDGRDRHRTGAGEDAGLTTATDHHRGALTTVACFAEK
jgi:pimeloyl-ACP methyl ester carboxylesterase